MKKNFNLKIFKRLLGFTKPYKLNFIFVSFSAIIISIFSILNQYFLKIAVDEYITPKDYNGLLYLIVIMILILCFQVTFQFLFIYFTNLLGQKVVYDLRTKLFKTMLKKFFEPDRNSLILILGSIFKILFKSSSLSAIWKRLQVFLVKDYS